MNTKITEQDIMDIINELEDEQPTFEVQFRDMVQNGAKVEPKFDTSNLTRWEDRTAMDRFVDFVQTTEPSDLLKLAGVAVMALGLLVLPFVM